MRRIKLFLSARAYSRHSKGLLDHSSNFARAGCDLADSSTGAIIPPIHLSTTYERDENLNLVDGYMYSRISNPTRRLFEETLASLENGNEAFAFSSGMQAATSLLLACPDIHIILPDDKYYAVFTMCSEIFSKWGMSHENVDMTDLQSLTIKLEEATKRNQAVLLWLETPSNPLCKVTDIHEVTLLASSIIRDPAKLSVLVDSTWTTPYITKPLDFGAHFVLHSVTKYIGGHTDLLAGSIISSKENAADKNILSSTILNKLRIIQQVMKCAVFICHHVTPPSILCDSGRRRRVRSL